MTKKEDLGIERISTIFSFKLDLDLMNGNFLDLFDVKEFVSWAKALPIISNLQMEFV